MKKTAQKIPFELFEHLSGYEFKMAGVAVPSEVLVDPDDVDRRGGKIGIDGLNILNNLF